MHDSSIYKDLEIFKDPGRYFSGDEYLLGDCGYPLSMTLITPFRTPYEENGEKELFNYRLSKARVKVKHANGMLKERFQILKGIRTVINGDKALKHVCQIIESCLILHNMLISKGDLWHVSDEPEQVDEEWGFSNEVTGRSNAEEKRLKLLQHVDIFYKFK